MPRIVVNWDLCETNEVCCGIAPGYFQIGDDDLMQVVREDVAPEDVEAVERAVRRCPKAAISLVEE